MSPVVSTLFVGPNAGEIKRIEGSAAGVVGVGVALGVALGVGFGVAPAGKVSAAAFVISNVSKSVISCMSVNPSMTNFIFP